MNNAEMDVREALDRLVRSQPPPLRTADVVAAGRRARRRRSLLAGAGTVAGVVAVLAAAAVLPAALTDRGASEATPAATTAAGPPTVPGISAAQARQVVEACVASPQLGDPISTPSDQLQLFNASQNPWGTSYLIYGPDTYLSCLDPSDGGPDRAIASVGQQQEWLLGPLAVDRAIADGALHGAPGTFTVEGRVSASVAKVQITYGSSTLTVPAVNGTFMAAVSVPDRELATGRGSFRAYDSTDHLIYASPKDSRESREEMMRTCWATPDGTVIQSALLPSGSTQKCKTAVRWR